MNNKNYFIGAVILVIVIAGGYFFMKGKSQETTPVSTGQKMTETVSVTSAPTVPGVTTSISYTDTGFVPKTITVSVGTKVVWKNTGDKPMWVASAVHPTHQELPGFDQLTSMGKGGAYAYTFTKKGTWKYHNHVFPADTGIVVVE